MGRKAKQDRPRKTDAPRHTKPGSSKQGEAKPGSSKQGETKPGPTNLAARPFRRHKPFLILTIALMAIWLAYLLLLVVRVQLA